ncbi:MAG TPA: hypothetical protein VEA99_20285 [Gemmatimonadaceae bacterium]|nr:hypothetical protein [Gemmatimonadaceae bacterium]
MTERRFDPDEVAAIFERAARALPPGARDAPAAEGLTLAELQEIGREVGIPAEAIVAAARDGGTVAPPPARTLLGLPVGVSRTVHLGRRVTDEEWERIVVDLRETFDARGHLSREGSLRQWTNGSLQALLEPTPDGDRLRLRTRKSDAPGLLTGGLMSMGTALVTLGAAAARGALGDTGMVVAVGALGLFGAGMFASAALRLPAWARTRRRQMEEVATRLAPSTGDAARGRGTSVDAERR